MLIWFVPFLCVCSGCITRIASELGCQYTEDGTAKGHRSMVMKYEISLYVSKKDDDGIDITIRGLEVL